MIILAAAIILSLSNSGIIGKATKAKTDSDTANLKEYVNTLRAEWELMTAEEQSAEGSFEAYANKKLAENGYKGAVGADGEIYSNLNENAMAAIKAGIKVGDTVTGYTIDATTYETSGEENTCTIEGVSTEIGPQPNTIATNTDITWKYLGVNANGELEIMADLSATAEVVANTKITLGGKGGYLKGANMLNVVCEKLYSKDGVGTARSMNIDDVNNLLGYTGPKGEYIDGEGKTVTTAEPLTIGEIDSKLGRTLGENTNTPDGGRMATYYSDSYYISKTSTNIKNKTNANLVYNAQNTYWLASPCVSTEYSFGDPGYVCFNIRSVSSSTVGTTVVFSNLPSMTGDSHAIRPVVKLDPSVKLVKNATAANTWNISK